MHSLVPAFFINSSLERNKRRALFPNHPFLQSTHPAVIVNFLTKLRWQKVDKLRPSPVWHASLQSRDDELPHS